MRFCPGEKCEHYGKATKYPRQCYYEPQCWKGYLDSIVFTINLRLSRKIQREKGRRKDKDEEHEQNSAAQL